MPLRLFELNGIWNGIWGQSESYDQFAYNVLGIISSICICRIFQGEAFSNYRLDRSLLKERCNLIHGRQIAFGISHEYGFDVVSRNHVGFERRHCDRDGADKVYVQHLIEKEGAQFFEWLQEGAATYICGDVSRMAADVDKAIRKVVAAHGGLDEAGVDTYMTSLSHDHRYQRDVY